MAQAAKIPKALAKMWGVAPQFQKLYTAPGQLMDYCDSSGCLPGQIPLAGSGLSSKSIISKAAASRMAQVTQLPGWEAVSLQQGPVK